MEALWEEVTLRVIYVGDPRSFRSFRLSRQTCLTLSIAANDERWLSPKIHLHCFSEANVILFLLPLEPENMRSVLKSPEL